MDNVAIALEHVDLLNGLDRLRVQLLQGGLELLVIVGAAGDVALLLVPRSALSTYGTQRRPRQSALGFILPVSDRPFSSAPLCVGGDGGDGGVGTTTYQFEQALHRQTSS